MPYCPDNPLIVQSDRSILLEVDNPKYEATRNALAPFAELVKSPEHIHTYRISPLSLWNAAAAGHTLAEIRSTLEQYGKYDVPENILTEIAEYFGRYGRIKIIEGTTPDTLLLKTDSDVLLLEILSQKGTTGLFLDKKDKTSVSLTLFKRGLVKQALIKLGYPVEDLAGYVIGTPLPFSLRKTTLLGESFALRRYQEDSAEIFFAAGGRKGGSGVIVLPCGAGKTVVGMAAMSLVRSHTLILTTNITAAKQWKRELLDKTDLREEDIGEYTGEIKAIRPVTVATYQIITYRKKKSEEFPHFAIFNANRWGLIIYDEVHLLPAPVFRITAGIQATRRLGLTATLVREDNKEDEVFSLIGPKKYDAPWKVLEEQGWIASAICTEVRVELPDNLKMEYAVAENRKKIRIAAENPAKEELVEALLKRHTGDLILIIGQYLDQINHIAARFNIPLITGATPTLEREKLYRDFREGKMTRLVVSKVGNFAVDLPDANVAIQVSGTFGSRQEEAQRLGRILRPKKNGQQARFYSLVTRTTCEQDFAMNRQLFLTEQGYSYLIIEGRTFLTSAKRG
ncbi:MAG: helicase [Elusimicrobia bacterium RIFOXYB2_FULL_49_7]|nr:MAG: helicase [Elusimicrobia bacterium RIFOXYB2_FULL_49_7]